MTNREWLENLSNESFAEWLTDLSNGKFYPEDLCMDFCPNARKNGTCTKCDANGDIECDLSINEMITHWLKSKKNNKVNEF